jgi:uncharacterized membrane protein
MTMAPVDVAAHLLLSYTVFYARRYIEDPDCLTFPGGQDPGVSDHLYFAAAVGTTFGTTDVESGPDGCDDR